MLKVLKGEGLFRRPRKADCLLITGDGSSLREDLRVFFLRQIPHEAMAIGRSYKIYPGRIDHWVTVDSEGLEWWAEHLPKDKIWDHTLRHTIGIARGFDVCWDLVDSLVHPDEMKWYGSSALFAVLIGKHLGFSHTILAGCPLDKKGHWWWNGDGGPEWEPQTYKAWRTLADEGRLASVWSLSGFTKDLLGEPKWESLSRQK